MRRFALFVLSDGWISMGIRAVRCGSILLAEKSAFQKMVFGDSGFLFCRTARYYWGFTQCEVPGGNVLGLRTVLVTGIRRKISLCILNVDLNVGICTRSLARVGERHPNAIGRNGESRKHPAPTLRSTLRDRKRAGVVGRGDQYCTVHGQYPLHPTLRLRVRFRSREGKTQSCI